MTGSVTRHSTTSEHSIELAHRMVGSSTHPGDGLAVLGSDGSGAEQRVADGLGQGLLLHDKNSNRREPDDC